MKSIKQAVCFLLVGLLCTVIIYPLLHELGHSLAAIALGGVTYSQCALQNEFT